MTNAILISSKIIAHILFGKAKPNTIKKRKRSHKLSNLKINKP